MKRFPTLFPIALLLLAAGCGSTPTRFYTLAPLAEGQHSNQDTATGPTVGVGPVELPKALDRPQIVTRRSQNEFDLGEFDHWAEPLAENFSQVLAENLRLALPAKRVAAYPWDRSTKVDYQVVVKVLRFDRDVGGDAVLQAHWSIRSPAGDHELLAREARYTKRPTGEDYPATVSAMNAVLEELSREVADAIRGLRDNTP